MEDCFRRQSNLADSFFAKFACLSTFNTRLKDMIKTFTAPMRLDFTHEIRIKLSLGLFIYDYFSTEKVVFAFIKPLEVEAV